MAAAKKDLGLPGLRGGLLGPRALVLPPLRGLFELLRLKIEVVLRGEVVGEDRGREGGDVDMATAVAAAAAWVGLRGVGVWFWALGERARTSS